MYIAIIKCHNLLSTVRATLLNFFFDGSRCENRKACKTENNSVQDSGGDLIILRAGKNDRDRCN